MVVGNTDILRPQQFPVRVGTDHIACGENRADMTAIRHDRRGRQARSVGGLRHCLW